MRNEQTPSSHIPEVLLRRAWLAVVVFACAMTAGVGGVLFLPNVYRATATVVVQREDVPEAFMRPGVAAELESRIQTITQEMLSRTRLETLIDRFALYPDLRGRAPIEDVVDRLRSDIKIELKDHGTAARPATVAFTVSYVGTDPPTLALVANGLATSYVEENLQIRGGQARSAAQLLKAQLDDVRQRLTVEDKQAATLREHYGNDLPEQTTANLAAIERLNTDLRFNNDKQERALDRRDALRQEPAAAAARAVAELSPTAKRRLELSDELVQLRARFKDQYPEVQRVQAEIARLDSLPSTGVDPDAPASATPATTPARVPRTAAADVERDLQALAVEEKSIRGRMDAIARRVEIAPQMDHEIKNQSRDLNTTVEMYYSLLKRYEDARLAENVELSRTGEQFRILDAALVPSAPAAPTRWQLLLLAGVLAAGLAAGAVFLAEQVDSSIHTLDELRAFAHVAVFATIPPIVTASDGTRRRWLFALAGTGTVGALALIFFVAQYLATGNVSLVRLLARGRI